MISWPGAGVSVFTYPTPWWWLVPLLATHLGGVLGAWTYYLAIELHWTKQVSSRQFFLLLSSSQPY